MVTRRPANRRRRGEHALDRQGTLQATCDCLRRDAERARPIKYVHRAAIERQSSTASSIRVLLRQVRPAHVARLVVALVVDAIERVQQRGPRADVIQEGFEGIAPCVAHPNPAATVIGVGLSRRRVAACLRVLPRVIFGCIELAVTSLAIADHLAAQATAATCVAALQFRGRAHDYGTAIAATTPERATLTGWPRRSFKGCQAAESTAGQITFGRWHSGHMAILLRK